MCPGASYIEYLGMGMRLVTPIAESGALKKDQATTSALIKNPKLLRRLNTLYDKLKTHESGLLSLYEKNIDPMYSTPYQKLLSDTFYNTKGKFTNWFLIEANKRFFFDCLFVIFLLSIPCMIYRVITTILGSVNMSFLEGIKKGIKYLKNNSLSLKEYGMMVSVLLYLFVVWSLMIYMSIQLYKKYSTLNHYLSNRLVAVQSLFEIARETNKIIKNNPTLEAHCAGKLIHTRKLFTGNHENEEYNKLANIFLTHDFKNWSLVFNSSGTLLTTLTLLEENIHMP